MPALVARIERLAKLALKFAPLQRSPGRPRARAGFSARLPLPAHVAVGLVERNQHLRGIAVAFRRVELDASLQYLDKFGPHSRHQSIVALDFGRPMACSGAM
jgi:hypothetical protein